MVPVIVTLLSILTGLEKKSSLKSFGIFLCFATTLAGMIYQITRIDPPPGISSALATLQQDFFLIIQVLSLVCGIISQKKLIMSRPFGLFGLAFWIYFFAMIVQWCAWFCQYINNTMPLKPDSNEPAFEFNDFFSFKMFGHLFEMGAVFGTAMIIEMFNFVTLMYINKTGQVSKVALFSTLHASYIIIFGLINSKYSEFMTFYIVLIYVGYVIIFAKKRKDAKNLFRSNQKTIYFGKLESKKNWTGLIRDPSLLKPTNENYFPLVDEEEEESDMTRAPEEEEKKFETSVN